MGLGIKCVFSAVLFLFLTQSASAEMVEIPHFFPQENSQWCWAALTQIFQNYYYGFTDPQCKVVTRYIRGAETEYCCDSKRQKSADCDQPYFLNRPLKALSILGSFNNEVASGDLLRIEFEKGQPVGIRVQFEDYAHYLLLYGAKKDFIYVYDTRNGGDFSIVSKKSLEDFKEGKWTSTYYTRSQRPVLR